MIEIFSIFWWQVLRRFAVLCPNMEAWQHLNKWCNTTMNLCREIRSILIYYNQPRVQVLSWFKSELKSKFELSLALCYFRRISYGSIVFHLTIDSPTKSDWKLKHCLKHTPKKLIFIDIFYIFILPVLGEHSPYSRARCGYQLCLD